MASADNSSIFLTSVPAVPLSTPLPATASSMSAKTIGFCGSRLDALSVANGVLQNDCFIDMLNIVPHCIFLLISVPILIIWSKSVIGTKKVKTWVHFRVHAFRWVTILFLMSLNILEITEGLTSDAHDPDTVNYHVFVPPLMALMGSIMSITFYHNVEIWNSPGFLLILLGYWASAFVLKILKLISLYRNNMDWTHIRVDFTWIVIVIYAVLIFIEMDVLRIQKYAFFQEPCPVHSPEELANLKYIQPYVSFLSKATFWWISGLMRKGYRHVVELHDLGKLPITEQATWNYKKVWIAFENQKQSRARVGLKPSLLISMFFASWPAILWAGFLRLTSDLLAFIGPWWIEDILNYCNAFHQSQPSHIIQNTSTLVSTVIKSATPPVTPVPYNFINKTITDRVGETLKRQAVLTVTVSEFFSNGYILIMFVFIIMLLQYIMVEYHFFIMIREGMRMKAAVQVMVYSKVQQLSTQALTHGRVTESEIMSYVTLECNNLMVIYSFIHYLWSLPLQIIVGFILIFFKIGSSAIIGLLLVIVHAFLHIAVAKKLFSMQNNISGISEQRMKKANQLIKGIKQIKLNAWENCFSSFVSKDRKKEMKKLYKIAYFKSLIEFLVTAAPIASTSLTFLYYFTVESESLSPGKVFSVAAIFQVMCYPLYFLCVIYTSFLSAKSSSKQLTSFLQSTTICQHPSTFFTKCTQMRDSSTETKLDTLMKYDVKSDRVSMAFHNGAMRGSISSVESMPFIPSPIPARQSSGASLLDTIDPSFRKTSMTPSLYSELEFYARRGAGPRRNTNGMASNTEDEEDVPDLPNMENRLALEIIDASFSKDLTSETPCLRDISIQVPMGKMTIITGPPGSGKSALLSAILGEMVLDSGIMEWSRGCNLAYCSQPPWLMNATVQENILFGQGYNWRKYKKVLHAVGLNFDLTMWPARDRTEVGEQGNLLTEGQRQRISLARALYSSANTIIMDDPFSTMEPHLARSVFDDSVIRRILKQKRTAILVTTQVHHISSASHIIVVKRHQIQCQGKLGDIKRLAPDLYEGWRRILKEYKKENELEFDKMRRTSLGNISEPVHKLSIQSNLGIPISRQVSQMSVMTENSLEDEGLEDDEELDEEESTAMKLADLRDVRPFPVHMVVEFLKLCSSYLVFVAFLLLIGKHALIAAADLWLVNWKWKEPSIIYKTQPNSTIVIPKLIPVNDMYYVCIYVAICGSVIVITGLTGLLLKFTLVRGAGRLHHKMLTFLTSLPVIHFESSHHSTILSTFSADSRIVDQILPTTLELLLRFILQGLLVLIMCCIAMPYFVLISICVITCFYFLRKFYHPSLSQLHRLQNLSKLPLFNHFSEILSGLRTIRAYRVQYWFTGYVTHAIDVFNVVFIYIYALNRWLAVRLDILGCLIMFMASLGSLALSVNNGANGTLVGLCLLYAIMAPIYLNMIARHMSELDNNVCSLERVIEYASESPPSIDPPDCIEVPETWPRLGDIHFRHIALNYDPEESPVVRDVTFTIKDAEKVAFCGHAGSGRSSLILSLFKMIHVHEGKIFINNQDISVVPSYILRSRLSIIPHDPIMFDGTVRFNLDPEGKYRDPEIWEALNAVQLKRTVQELPHKLETAVLCEGKEFSVGQRQLFCFARAYMRDSRIVIVEQEHTNDDALMEETIQELIQTVFRDATVLVTLHHLTHLNNYHRVMVLDQGKIIEFDKAEHLLANENSMLSALVREGQQRRSNKVVITVS